MPLLLGTLTLLTTAAVKDSSLALRGLSAGSSPTGTTPIQLSAAPSSGSASPTWRHGRVTAPQGSGAAGRVRARGGQLGRCEGGTQRGPADTTSSATPGCTHCPAGPPHSPFPLPHTAHYFQVLQGCHRSPTHPQFPPSPLTPFPELTQRPPGPISPRFQLTPSTPSQSLPPRLPSLPPVPHVDPQSFPHPTAPHLAPLPAPSPAPAAPRSPLPAAPRGPARSRLPPRPAGPRAACRSRRAPPPSRRRPRPRPPAPTRPLPRGLRPPVPARPGTAPAAAPAERHAAPPWLPRAAAQRPHAAGRSEGRAGG